MLKLSQSDIHILSRMSDIHPPSPVPHIDPLDVTVLYANAHYTSFPKGKMSSWTMKWRVNIEVIQFKCD